MTSYRDLLDAIVMPAEPAGPPPQRIGDGAAADAIRNAEAALAHQNTAAAHVDLQVVTAVLNARATHDAGLAELSALQRDLETAVAARPDLDTPAGAREFERYLIGKLREMRNVVDNSGLDATSKAELAAALAALYASATPEPPDRGPAENHQDTGPLPAAPRTCDPAAPCTSDLPPWDYGSEESEPADSVEVEPGWVDGAAPSLPVDSLPSPASATVPGAGAAAPVAPATVSPVSPWTGGFPGGGFSLGGLPAMGSAIGPPPTLTDWSKAELPERFRDDELGVGPITDPAAVADPGARDLSPGDEIGTTVDLPDGDTVTAPSPELAAAITAAVGGTPIPEAFRQQGISLPAPGSPVAVPLEPARLSPGDIGVFNDRHALALGNGKALLDGQIQPIASVVGPGFLGWQHPPPSRPADVMLDVPPPNRIAVTAPS